MSSFKPQQHRLSLRGRQFHFVSYEGQPGNAARLQSATDPAWFMMSCGKRWAVMPYQAGQNGAELDRLFTEWLETHVFC